jgi:hypothetical protein
LALTPGTRLGVYEVTARISVRRTQSGFAERIARGRINGFELIVGSVTMHRMSTVETKIAPLFGCQVGRGSEGLRTERAFR